MAPDFSLEQLYFFLPRILTALLCGAIIGLDRGARGKDAGLRTNILICVGSAIFVSLAEYVQEIRGNDHHDPLRVWGALIQGIGFLGAGAIGMGRVSGVRGLTTAGYIWTNCAIGIAVGWGLFVIPIILTLGLVVTMRLIEAVEDHLVKKAGRILHVQVAEVVREDASTPQPKDRGQGEGHSKE